MSDFIHVERAARPWEPSHSDTRLVDTYDFYDMPLVGIIEQHGVRYLFRCIAGQAEAVNVWAYSLVHDDDVSRIEDADTPKEFDVAVGRTIVRRPGVVAIAVEGFGIVSSLELEKASQWRNGRSNTQRLLDDVDAYLAQMQEEVAHQRTRLMAVG